MEVAIYDHINSLDFVKELKSGSLVAFERLDQVLARHLINFLRFIMNVPEADAEELASDTLLAVSSHINKFDHGRKTKLTTWIFEIAKNKAIDFHRKPSLDTVAINEKFPECSSPGPDAGRNRVYRNWLDRELAALAEEDRALLLWRAKDIPYKQIGEWLGISEGAARTRGWRRYRFLMSAFSEADWGWDGGRGDYPATSDRNGRDRLADINSSKGRLPGEIAGVRKQTPS